MPARNCVRLGVVENNTARNKQHIYDLVMHMQCLKAYRKFMKSDVIDYINQNVSFGSR